MNEFFLKTEDNIKIAFNHYDSNRNTVVIIAHGWYMCKDTSAFKSMSEDFFKNYDVITMDFRGHGKSSGLYTFTANETKDLKVVIDYAKKKYSKISLIGFSLGAALVITHTATHKDIHCLITVSAPGDFDKIENRFWKPEAFIPTIQKFDIKENRNIRPGNIFLKKIKPIDVIQNVSPIPTLFLAGKKDPTVYSWHAEALYEKAGNPKAVEIFEKDFHAEDLYLNSKNKFLDVCNSWLNKHKSPLT